MQVAAEETARSLFYLLQSPNFIEFPSLCLQQPTMALLLWLCVQVDDEPNDRPGGKTGSPVI
jgi:hypothetical protein